MRSFIANHLQRVRSHRNVGRTENGNEWNTNTFDLTVYSDKGFKKRTLLISADRICDLAKREKTLIELKSIIKISFGKTSNVLRQSKRARSRPNHRFFSLVGAEQELHLEATEHGQRKKAVSLIIDNMKSLDVTADLEGIRNGIQSEQEMEEKEIRVKGREEMLQQNTMEIQLDDDAENEQNATMHLMEAREIKLEPTRCPCSVDKAMLNEMTIKLEVANKSVIAYKEQNEKMMEQLNFKNSLQKEKGVNTEHDDDEYNQELMAMLIDVIANLKWKTNAFHEENKQLKDECTALQDKLVNAQNALKLAEDEHDEHIQEIRDGLEQKLKMKESENKELMERIKSLKLSKFAKNEVVSTKRMAAVREKSNEETSMEMLFHRRKGEQQRVNVVLAADYLYIANHRFSYRDIYAVDVGDTSLFCSNPSSMLMTHSLCVTLITVKGFIPLEAMSHESRDMFSLLVRFKVESYRKDIRMRDWKGTFTT